MIKSIHTLPYLIIKVVSKLIWVRESSNLLSIKTYCWNFSSRINHLKVLVPFYITYLFYFCMRSVLKYVWVGIKGGN